MSLFLARNYPAFSSAYSVSRCRSRLPLQRVKEFGRNTRGLGTYTREQLALADSLRCVEIDAGLTKAEKVERLRVETNRVTYRGARLTNGVVLLPWDLVLIKRLYTLALNKVGTACSSFARAVCNGAQNDGKPLIDLHGMDVKGAEEKVLEKIEWARKVGLKVLMFIVGTLEKSGPPDS
ncbi:hypothetical protein PENSPDRAFT_204398 [Peniophora sp. CONT]|nr:hypothetical protein PENSPDRAFT_204398 [Peniophora sp. CONT]